MQIELQMVGHHRNSNITIKNVEFKNGKAMVYGADELVGNICRYLETYGAFQPHVAERKQAILDGEGDMLGVRAARRNLAKAEEAAAKARADILSATEKVEEKIRADEAEERAAAPAPVKVETADVEVEDKPASEGRGSEPSTGSKGSKSNKSNQG